MWGSASPAQAVAAPGAREPAAPCSVGRAFALWAPLGWAGAHHFYLGRRAFGLIYLATLGLGGVGWLLDAWRLPRLVREANRALASEEPQPWEADLWDAYILALPLGVCGAHHFYLRNYGYGTLYLLTLGLCGVGWLADLLRMERLVQRANYDHRFGKMDFYRERKHLDDAYVLALPLGLLGLHNFYLRRAALGAVYAATLGLLGVGWIADLARMPALVSDANRRIHMEVSGRQKHLTDAYLLGLLGFLGLHRFYLGEPRRGALYLATLGGGLVLWLHDLARMPALVREANARQGLSDEAPGSSSAAAPASGSAGAGGPGGAAAAAADDPYCWDYSDYGGQQAAAGVEAGGAAAAAGFGGAGERGRYQAVGHDAS